MIPHRSETPQHRQEGYSTGEHTPGKNGKRQRQKGEKFRENQVCLDVSETFLGLGGERGGENSGGERTEVLD